MTTQLKGKKILFATVPADGHFNPVSHVAKHFHDAGADVRWLSSEIYAAKLQKLGIRRYPLVHTLDIHAGNIADLVPEIRTNDPFKRMTLYRVQYAKRSIEFFEDIKEIYQTFPFDFVVADSFFPAIPFIKPLLGVPVFAIGVVPLAAYSADTAPYGLGLLPPENDEERNQYKLLYKEMPEKTKEATDIFTSYLTKANIPHERSTIENILVRSADLYLQIGVPGFEYKRSDLGTNVRFIGSLLPTQAITAPNSWFNERLNRYKKVALVTQGTVETDPGKLIEPALQAFIDSDVLVIVTTSGRNTQALRQKYKADNIIIENFIPFNEVMRYVDVYITNGGYGGTTFSIMNRVPMVAAGLHEGKNEICTRIGYFKIGIDLKTETPTASQVHDAFYKVLNEQSYKENVAKLADEYEKHHSLKEISEHILSFLDRTTD